MKTAVEFLLDKYKSQNTLLFAEDFEQALEMEKEQKIDFALTVHSEIVETDKDFVDVIKSMNL